ncbi:MAG: SAM-dependent methyltransferase, partial [Pseudomonadota bacterium]
MVTNTQTAEVGTDRKPPAPSAWVTRHLSGAPANEQIADIACGAGRHTRYALNAGYSVIAIDRDTSGLADLSDHSRLTAINEDLEAGNRFSLAPASMGCVIVTNYLFRPIIPDLVACLKPNGILIYETFAVGQERFGRPKNPDFLLKPGELIDATRPALIPIEYQHTQLSDP